MPDRDHAIIEQLHTLKQHALAGWPADASVAGSMITLVGNVFRHVTRAAGFSPRDTTRVTTKFRDAGRRSAPWRQASKRVPGRPQDGEDGNRISRWLLPKTHKFYADKTTATLVEVKYYLQALSMSGAPPVPEAVVRDCFGWLVEHPVEPDFYLDPIQLIPINFRDFLADRRLVTSGHLVPLDRGGRHEPKNAFLMLARSNQLQGNLTVEELVALMEQIVLRHQKRRAASSPITTG
ncbi:MAG: hypothetical protein FJ290_22290 [Planctomycetes bacterium]|nr:hypothetical protein [Planctomycetota bacterium]